MVSFISFTDEESLQRERQKARDLRAGQWWKNQVGNGVCYYCKGLFHPKVLTMDHKIPLVRGGKSTKNNMVPCCKACNNEKKHMLLHEWIAKREQEGRPLACTSQEWS